MLTHDWYLGWLIDFNLSSRTSSDLEAAVLVLNTSPLIWYTSVTVLARASTTIYPPGICTAGQPPTQQIFHIKTLVIHRYVWLANLTGCARIYNFKWYLAHRPCHQTNCCHGGYLSSTPHYTVTDNSLAFLKCRNPSYTSHCKRWRWHDPAIISGLTNHYHPAYSSQCTRWGDMLQQSLVD